MLKLIFGHYLPEFYQQMMLFQPHSEIFSVRRIFVRLFQDVVILSIVEILVHTLFAQYAYDTHHVVFVKLPTLLCLTTWRQEHHKFFSREYMFPNVINRRTKPLGNKYPNTRNIRTYFFFYMIPADFLLTLVNIKSPLSRSCHQQFHVKVLKADSSVFIHIVEFVRKKFQNWILFTRETPFAHFAQRAASFCGH